MCYAPTALCRDAVVTVMQTADFWKGDNATYGRRCDRAWAWRVLAEREVDRVSGHYGGAHVTCRAIFGTAEA